MRLQSLDIARMVFVVVSKRYLVYWQPLKRRQQMGFHFVLSTVNQQTIEPIYMYRYQRGTYISVPQFKSFYSLMFKTRYSTHNVCASGDLMDKYF
jgi:hypothetical protein